MNDGDAPFVGPEGPVLIVVSGATVSTVNVRVAGVASTLPAVSVARTENVYEPFGRRRVRLRRRARGVRARRRPACPACTRTSPASVDVNVNDGAVAFVVPVGPPVIVVSGATVSTVNVRVAGDGSTLRAASVARTENV